MNPQGGALTSGWLIFFATRFLKGTFIISVVYTVENRVFRWNIATLIVDRVEYDRVNDTGAVVDEK